MCGNSGRKFLRVFIFIDLVLAVKDAGYGVIILTTLLVSTSTMNGDELDDDAINTIKIISWIAFLCTILTTWVEVYIFLLIRNGMKTGNVIECRYWWIARIVLLILYGIIIRIVVLTFEIEKMTATALGFSVLYRVCELVYGNWYIKNLRSSSSKPINA